MAYINGNEIFFSIINKIGGDQPQNPLTVGETVILQAGEVGTAGEVTELEEE